MSDIANNRKIKARVQQWLSAQGFINKKYYWYSPDKQIRVQFKELVVRIEVYNPRAVKRIYRWGKIIETSPWQRISGCHYQYVQFFKDGFPSGLGFQTHSYLRQYISGPLKDLCGPWGRPCL